MDIFVRSDDVEHFREDVKAVCRELFHLPKKISVSIKKLTLGLTNQLFKVTIKLEGVYKSPLPFLLRIFGAEGIIDRKIENALFVSLANSGIAPGYLGRFANGRCEEFLVGWNNLEHADMRRAPISRCIAEKLAQLHQFQVPASLHVHFNASKSGLWDQLEIWVSVLTSKPIKDENISCKLCEIAKEFFGGPGFPLLRENIAEMKRNTPTNAHICFCHNDALAFNIMSRQKLQNAQEISSRPSNASSTHTICENSKQKQYSGFEDVTEKQLNDCFDADDFQLIDFEYGCYNYRGFDIANHFCEWAGGCDDADPKYEYFPSETEQLAFCSAYLDALSQGKPDMEQSRNEMLCTLMNEVAYFVQVVHLYWGIWALNQACDEGCGTFDYLQYGRRRLVEGRRRRKGVPNRQKAIGQNEMTFSKKHTSML